MKVLYGVQGTGNGHITRARVMAKAFDRAGIKVDWVFSGRDRDDFFDMEVFGDYRLYRGLTFRVKDNRIDWRQTVRQTAMKEFLRDVRGLDLSGYDRVITDFEPVVAWAAQRQSRPCIGIGHQYAFDHAIPKAGNSLIAEAVMRWFAPVTTGLGLHWYHYEASILPPIIEQTPQARTGDLRRTLLYLPFESSWRILNLAHQFNQVPFVMHCADIPPGQYANVQVKAFSRDGFQRSLAECGTVISSAGFELISEALGMGKRILVTPLKGQMEQASNARALSELGLATVARELSADTLAIFLSQGKRRRVIYPDVAGEVVDWLIRDPEQPVAEMVDRLWDQVEFLEGINEQVA